MRRFRPVTACICNAWFQLFGLIVLQKLEISVVVGARPFFWVASYVSSGGNSSDRVLSSNLSGKTGLAMQAVFASMSNNSSADR